MSTSLPVLTRFAILTKSEIQWGLLLGTGSSSPLVHQVGNHFEVSRVTTESVITEVVDLLLSWDVPIEVGVNHQVDGHSLAVEAHPAIATASASTGVGSVPDKAWGWSIIQHEAGISDGDLGKDTLHDVDTAVVQLTGIDVKVKHQDTSCSKASLGDIPWL